MKASVIRGKVTFINLEQNEIRITDIANEERYTVKIVANTELSLTDNWYNLTGKYVEVALLDDEILTIFPLLSG